MSPRMIFLLLSICGVVTLSAGCRQSSAAPDVPPEPAGAPTAAASEDEAATATASPLNLADEGPAPDFKNDVWINSEPLRLVDLRGKVVLVEFWTFGCVNCQRVIPYVNEWYEAYGGEGLEIVGVHYPEFQYERDIDNVRAAVSQLNIKYPVAIDNDRLTWAAYDQRFWPTLYLLDKEGHIRYKHIGEGAYAETEAAIRQLLAEPDPE